MEAKHRKLSYGEGTVYQEKRNRRVKGRDGEPDSIRVEIRFRGEISIAGQRLKVSGRTRKEVLEKLKKLTTTTTWK
jgi:hypothetical protein